MKELFTTFKLLLMPKKMWPEILLQNNSEIDKQLLFPMLGLASLSAFARHIYEAERTVSESIIDAICIFCSFYISYLLGVTVCGKLKKVIAAEYGDAGFKKGIKAVFSYTMVIPALVFCLQNLLPTTMAILNIFPLYLLYILSKSPQYLGIKENYRIFFYVGIFVMTILMPVIIYFTFISLMPNAQ